MAAKYLPAEAHFSKKSFKRLPLHVNKERNENGMKYRPWTPGLCPTPIDASRMDEAFASKPHKRTNVLSAQAKVIARVNTRLTGRRRIGPADAHATKGSMGKYSQTDQFGSGTVSH